MTNDVPPELRETADRVARTLEAAARSVDSDHESVVTARRADGEPSRRRLDRPLILTAAAVAVVFGVVAVVVGDRGDDSGRVTTDDPAGDVRPELGVPLDLGFPPDLLDDAGRVRALFDPQGDGPQGVEDPTDFEPVEPRNVIGGALAFDTDGDRSVIVVAVDDPDTARAEIEAVVNDPTRLQIVKLPAEPERRAVAEAAEEMVGERGHVGWIGRGGVPEAMLDVGEEQLAADLLERFGATLRITVAGHPFPYADNDRCPALPPTDPALASDVEVLTPEITESSAASALVRMTNTSDDIIEVQEPPAGPGTWDGLLVLPGTSTVVGHGVRIGMAGSTAEARAPVSLAPDETHTVGASIPQVACRVTPRTGTQLRPGDYELVVRMVRAGQGTIVSSARAPVAVVDQLPGPEERAAAGPDRAIEEPDGDTAAVLDRFLAFADAPTSDALRAIPPGEFIRLRHSGGESGVEAGLFVNSAAWAVGIGDEETTVLDLVNGFERVEVTQGPPRWCTGPLQVRSAWRQPAPDITIEQIPESSCDEWLAVGLGLDDAGRLVSVSVFTDAP